MRLSLHKLLLAGACCYAGSVVGSEPDAFLGAWLLDTKASQYDATDLPRRMLITMDATESGVHYRSETQFATGAVRTVEYTADYEQHLAAVTGDQGMLLPVFVKRIDARTQEVCYVQGLQVVANSRRVVSRDGKTLTITTISKDPTGKSHLNVGVYVKQA